MFNNFIIPDIVYNDLIKYVWDCSVLMSVVRSSECVFSEVSLHSY